MTSSILTKKIVSFHSTNQNNSMQNFLQFLLILKDFSHYPHENESDVPESSYGFPVRNRIRSIHSMYGIVGRDVGPGLDEARENSLMNARLFTSTASRGVHAFAAAALRRSKQTQLRASEAGMRAQGMVVRQ